LTGTINDGRVLQFCGSSPSLFVSAWQPEAKVRRCAGDAMHRVRHVNFDAVLERLQIALGQPLPGAPAQALMAPRPRREWPAGFNPARIRHAAGLLLVFPIEGAAHIVLTVRAGTLGRHGGQVSLPGGVAEAGETFERAALREAHEEVGLAADAVTVLGALTPIDIPVSGFRLHPIVATAAERPRLTPADAEVASILEVPIAELFDPSRHVSTMREGRSLAAPAFRIGVVELWGATAMVVAEFLVLLGWMP
jgi:8-oxo-dGTP pyrophosphatase MutT (NUDIX family)